LIFDKKKIYSSEIVSYRMKNIEYTPPYSIDLKKISPIDEKFIQAIHVVKLNEPINKATRYQ
jgi:hypothetical protein